MWSLVSNASEYNAARRPRFESICNITEALSEGWSIAIGEPPAVKLPARSLVTLSEETDSDTLVSSTYTSGSPGTTCLQPSVLKSITEVPHRSESPEPIAEPTKLNDHLESLKASEQPIPPTIPPMATTSSPQTPNPIPVDTTPQSPPVGFCGLFSIKTPSFLRKLFGLGRRHKKVVHRKVLVIGPRGCGKASEADRLPTAFSHPLSLIQSTLVSKLADDSRSTGPVRPNFVFVTAHEVF